MRCNVVLWRINTSGRAGIGELAARGGCHRLQVSRGPKPELATFLKGNDLAAIADSADDVVSQKRGVDYLIDV
jgi:hypothetical protein